MKNVIIADDHKIFRDGLKLLINSYGYNVVGEANSTDELRTIDQNLHVDVFILDCQMPSEGPVAMLHFIKKYFPSSKIVYMTGLQSGGLFRQLHDLNADAIISKAGGPNEILIALESVLNGNRYLDKEIEQYLSSVENILTKKEVHVLELVLQGMTNSGIAEKLFNSERTINNHRTSLMKKLGAHSIIDLIKITEKKGFYKI